MKQTIIGSAQVRGPAFNRRRFLQGVGGAGLAAVVAGQVAGSAQATPPSRFDLTAAARVLFTQAQLGSVTVQQSFAFDVRNRRVFVAQRLDGSSATAGDLTISKLDDDGRLCGEMTLLGYGHGVSIAAQPAGRSTLLWTEADANANGYGTRLARFAWQDGAVYEREAPEVTKIQPVPEALETTCAIDPVEQTMVVRYHTSAGKRFAWFRLDDVASAAPARLGDFAQPAGLGTFQGYAASGRWLYVLDGNAYSEQNPYPGNAYLGAIDLRTGQLVERTLTTAGAELSFREPEGLAVGLDPEGRPLLYVGFASGEPGDRRSNLYYLKKRV